MRLRLRVAAQYAVAVESTGCKNTPPTPHLGHATMTEQTCKTPETDDAKARTRNCLVRKTAFCERMGRRTHLPSVQID